MKKVATIQNGKNFSAVNVGKLSEIKDYVLQLSPEIPPRVEYELTSRGKSLLPLIDNLLSWASTNMDGIMQSRETFFLK